MVRLDGAVGSEQFKERPCLIVQNYEGNTYSPTTLIVPLTKQNKKSISTHYALLKKDYPFLNYNSLVLTEQIRCVDIEKRLDRKIGSISKKDLDNILKVIENNFH